MRKFFKSGLARETLSYLLVGGMATLVSSGLQFVFTTVFLFGYDVSSILSFTLATPISFFLNRWLTFKARQLPLGKTMLRFLLVVIPCFFMSYFLLKPGLNFLFLKLDLAWPEEYQIFAKQMTANGIYIVVNYLGQKFFAFRKPTQTEDDTEIKKEQAE